MRFIFLWVAGMEHADSALLAELFSACGNGGKWPAVRKEQEGEVWGWRSRVLNGARSQTQLCPVPRPQGHFRSPPLLPSGHFWLDLLFQANQEPEQQEIHCMNACQALQEETSQTCLCILSAPHPSLLPEQRSTLLENCSFPTFPAMWFWWRLFPQPWLPFTNIIHSLLNSPVKCQMVVLKVWFEGPLAVSLALSEGPPLFTLVIYV